MGKGKGKNVKVRKETHKNALEQQLNADLYETGRKRHKKHSISVNNDDDYDETLLPTFAKVRYESHSLSK